MDQDQRISDREFIARLRVAIEQYLQAVDHWEAAYQKYYRLPGYASRVSDDLEAEQQQYEERRRELRAMLPRAHRLCLKHNLRDPLNGLLRISLGRYAPQERADSAIGRSERGAVTECLMELDAACLEWNPAPEQMKQEPERGSLIRRLVNYFY